MKHEVTRVKSLQECLKAIEPFIRDGEHLQTGRPFDELGELRSREVLANWLICAVYSFESQADRVTLTTDPLGGDGLIYDRVTEKFFRTEHVMVPRAAAAGDEAQDVESLILSAINLKHTKGKAYASGKSLVVFLNAGSKNNWYPNKVAKQLPKPFYFASAWVVGLHYIKDDEYVYGATKLDLNGGNAAMWLVRIQKNFDGWEVERIQGALNVTQPAPR